MPQQLEYDERGATFYYFLVSFYGLILLPATYFLWPYKRKGEFQSNLGSTRTHQTKPQCLPRVRGGVVGDLPLGQPSPPSSPFLPQMCPSRSWFASVTLAGTRE